MPSLIVAVANQDSAQKTASRFSDAVSNLVNVKSGPTKRRLRSCGKGKRKKSIFKVHRKRIVQENTIKVPSETAMEPITRDRPTRTRRNRHTRNSRLLGGTHNAQSTEQGPAFLHGHPILQNLFAVFIIITCFIASLFVSHFIVIPFLKFCKRKQYGYEPVPEDSGLFLMPVTI